MNFLFLLPFIFFCELGNTQVINQSTQQSQKIEQKVPKKTSVEIQAIQTRTFETTEKKLFRATLKVLQNNSYKDIISDFNGGLITAKLPSVDASDSAGTQVGKALGGLIVGAVIPFGGLFVPGKKVGQQDRSVNITLDPIQDNLVEIRVAFQITEKTTQSNSFVSTNETIEDDLTDHPEIYQAFFEQIDKELFVRENKY
mgnify:CR=1 FL=1|tara:strand:- start:834 stop:1430 length:597 start_codon:yes stop_codon:yes gene_type:complete